LSASGGFAQDLIVNCLRRLLDGLGGKMKTKNYDYIAQNFIYKGPAYAAKVSFVPDMFRIKLSGISFSIFRMASLPVQCVGII